MGRASGGSWVSGGAIVFWAAACGGCSREPEGRFAQEQPAAASDTAAIAGDGHGALRFAPTVLAAAGPGETVVPLLEIASGSDRRVDAIVAIHRSAASPGHDGADLEVAVELWSFDQSNAEGVLARVGEPQPLLRHRSGIASAPALPRLRVRMAAPGATVQRLLGADGDSPAAALDALALAARVVRDPTRGPDARVESLARVFAGLDDGLLFERDALGLALDRLAADQWQARATTHSSDRRASVETRGGDGLELLRKGQGWVVASTTGR